MRRPEGPSQCTAQAASRAERNAKMGLVAQMAGVAASAFSSSTSSEPSSCLVGAPASHEPPLPGSLGRMVTSSDTSRRATTTCTGARGRPHHHSTTSGAVPAHRVLPHPTRRSGPPGRARRSARTRHVVPSATGRLQVPCSDLQPNNRVGIPARHDLRHRARRPARNSTGGDDDGDTKAYLAARQRLSSGDKVPLRDDEDARSRYTELRQQWSSTSKPSCTTSVTPGRPRVRRRCHRIVRVG